MSPTEVKVCLVYRDGAQRKCLPRAMERLGCQCSETRLSQLGEHTAAIAPGDVIVLDISEVRGGACRELIARVRDRFEDTPIIAITQRGDAAATRYAIRDGAWDSLEIQDNESVLAQKLLDSINSIARSREVNVCEADPQGADERIPSEHRRFLDGLSGLRSLCRRQGKPLSILVLDLDYFGECNERYSTAFGDYILNWFGRALRSVSRGSDLVARYECDLFAVAMPDAQASHALELACRCRAEMKNRPPLHNREEYEVTVCAGVVESTVGFMETEQQLIRRALIALSHAKQAGVDQTVTWSDLLASEPSPKSLQHSGLESVTNWVGRVKEELHCAYLQSTRALVAAVETKDPYALEHSLKVSNYAEAIGRRMRLPARLIGKIRTAAFLHDVGKIGVPDSILVKPGCLTVDEYEIVKQHPNTAMDILGHVGFLADELPLILFHHERHDGKGYPSGIKAGEIPVGARVIAVADAIDVMFSTRSYKKPYDFKRVRAELRFGIGKQFDPQVVATALEWLEQTPIEHFTGSPKSETSARPAGVVDTLWKLRGSAGSGLPVWQ